LILDSWNFKRWGKSPMRENAGTFWGLILPLSAVYWLYFEWVNFYYPQWYYTGLTSGIIFQTFLTFISFATVIPAIVEIFWWLVGPVLAPQSPDSESNRPSRWIAAASISLGIILLTLPFFGGNFILNQGIWIAPFLIVSPILRLDFFKARNFFLIAASGLLSGLMWELFNFWSQTKWHYLVLPNSPRLFEMPLLGYLGFIPFAFSTIAAFLLIKKYIKPRLYAIIVAYLLAIVASYLFAVKL